MRLLVITRAPWLNDNGIGSTLTDFFSEFPNAEIYGLCLREAPKVTPLCKKNFYISEGQLLRALLHKGKIGSISGDVNNSTAQQKEEAAYNKAKRYNFAILQFFREMLWGTGLWKNEILDAYLEEVRPDIVFFPDFPCVYAHKVLKYVKEKTQAKVAIFHADDCYTLKQFSFSPVFWMYRFYLRKWVKSSVRLSSFHYVISDVQKEDYDKAFSVNNRLLTKFGDFDCEPVFKEKYGNPLQIVFTGNVGLNRWKSLAVIADALKQINKESVKAELKIYTANEITKNIKEKLDVPGVSTIMGKAPASEMPRIQGEADILVHVEAFDVKNKLAVRQSFSTKIVDYLKRGRAILAVGPLDVASIKHLKDNKCAIVATNAVDLVKELDRVIEDNSLLTEYASKAYACGRKFHNKKDMLAMLYEELR